MMGQVSQARRPWRVNAALQSYRTLVSILGGRTSCTGAGKRKGRALSNCSAARSVACGSAALAARLRAAS
jgi:hypothetical protein